MYNRGHQYGDAKELLLGFSDLAVLAEQPSMMSPWMHGGGRAFQLPHSPRVAQQFSLLSFFNTRMDTSLGTREGARFALKSHRLISSLSAFYEAS